MKKFALAGNPNCRKTTLFNLLTGSTAYVGNWPGVTVDKREGVYKKLSEPLQKMCIRDSQQTALEPFQLSVEFCVFAFFCRRFARSAAFFRLVNDVRHVDAVIMLRKAADDFHAVFLRHAAGGEVVVAYDGINPVSYTHLDVYKRQAIKS